MRRARARNWNRRLAGVALGVALGAAVPVSAQSSTPRVAVWVGSGAWLPADDVLSEIYGDPQWPLIVQGEVRIAGPVGLFAGVRLLARDGETIVEAPGAASPSFPVEFRTTSVRFGGIASGRVARVEIAAGIGAERLSGEERWPSEDLSFDVTAWGVLAQGSLRVPVWEHLALLGLIEYSWLTTQPDDPALGPVDLGGITFGGGVALRF